MNASPVGLSKKIRKISFSFLLLSFFLQKIRSTHTFSPAARGSGGEQLTPISNMKFERSLTHPSMVKV
jgi:hypothetical protein